MGKELIKRDEPWSWLLAVGKVMSNHAIANRKITLIYRGDCNAAAWRRAPKRLARKLTGPGGNTSVHYSPKHPDIIVLVTSGRWDRHYSAHDVHQLIGDGTVIKHVLGENHSDIPFYVGCEDIRRASETEVLPN